MKEKKNWTKEMNKTLRLIPIMSRYPQPKCINITSGYIFNTGFDLCSSNAISWSVKKGIYGLDDFPLYVDILWAHKIRTRYQASDSKGKIVLRFPKHSLWQVSQEEWRREMNKSIGEIYRILL